MVKQDNQFPFGTSWNNNHKLEIAAMFGFGNYKHIPEEQMMALQDRSKPAAAGACVPPSPEPQHSLPVPEAAQESQLHI